MHGDDRNREGEAGSPSIPLMVVGWLARAGGALATLLVIAMLALVCYAVGQRYVMGVPLAWADDLAGYMLVAFAAVGAAEALRRGDHIAIDLIAGRIPARSRWLLLVWSSLAVFIFSAVLAWSAFEQANFAYDFGAFTNDRLELPAWIPLAPLAMGSALLALMALAMIITALRRRPRS